MPRTLGMRMIKRHVQAHRQRLIASWRASNVAFGAHSPRRCLHTAPLIDDEQMNGFAA
ncbi:hypothetical protein ACSS6W_001634 [Trichoderma asperelloides]